MNAEKASLSTGYYLEAWQFQNGIIGVCYEDCAIKYGDSIMSASGQGKNFSEACKDYLEKIRGKTLVFNAFSQHRKEIRVL